VIFVQRRLEDESATRLMPTTSLFDAYEREPPRNIEDGNRLVSRWLQSIPSGERFNRIQHAKLLFARLEQPGYIFYKALLTAERVERKLRSIEKLTELFSGGDFIPAPYRPTHLSNRLIQEYSGLVNDCVKHHIELRRLWLPVTEDGILSKLILQSHITQRRSYLTVEVVARARKLIRGDTRGVESTVEPADGGEDNRSSNAIDREDDADRSEGIGGIESHSESDSEDRPGSPERDDRDQSVDTDRSIELARHRVDVHESVFSPLGNLSEDTNDMDGVEEYDSMNGGIDCAASQDIDGSARSTPSPYQFGDSFTAAFSAKQVHLTSNRPSTNSC